MYNYKKPNLWKAVDVASAYSAACREQVSDWNSRSFDALVVGGEGHHHH